jgi:hypothetical protein
MERVSFSPQHQTPKPDARWRLERSTAGRGRQEGRRNKCGGGRGKFNKIFNKLFSQ